MDDVLYLNESDIEANTCIRLQAEKMHGIVTKRSRYIETLMGLFRNLVSLQIPLSMAYWDSVLNQITRCSQDGAHKRVPNDRNVASTSASYIMQVLSSHVLFVFIMVVLFVFVSSLFAVNADFDICSVKTVYCFNHCLMAFSFWMDNIKGVIRLLNGDQDMGFVWPFW